MIKSKFQSNLILLLLLLLCFYFNLTFLKENPNSTSISTSPLTLTRFVIVKKNLNRKNISGTAKCRYRCRVGYNPHRNWPKYKRGGNERVSLTIAVESISDRIWSETRVGVFHRIQTQKCS